MFFAFSIGFGIVFVILLIIYLKVWDSPWIIGFGIGCLVLAAINSIPALITHYE